MLKSFENLSSFLLTNEISLRHETKHLILQHLSAMNNSITEYFPDEMETECWVENPFVDSLNLNNLSRKEREQQIDIVTDSTLKVKFQEVELAKFWIELLMEYLIFKKQKKRNSFESINAVSNYIFM